MKRRTGYVSNSSSSSFVVVLKDIDSNISKVSDQQEKMLYGQGFRYVRGNWRLVVEEYAGVERLADKTSFGKDEPLSMLYNVSCNEEDVMDFLMECRIPFVASTNYGTRTVHYDGIHDYYDTYVNSGRQFLIYGMRHRETDLIALKLSAKTRSFFRTRISDGADITDSVVEETIK